MVYWILIVVACCNAEKAKVIFVDINNINNNTNIIIYE